MDVEPFQAGCKLVFLLLDLGYLSSGRQLLGGLLFIVLFRKGVQQYSTHANSRSNCRLGGHFIVKDDNGSHHDKDTLHGVTHRQGNGMNGAKGQEHDFVA
eukprot:scaffold336_cov196-Amphora_coffeaeformis.AAC.13